MRITSRPYDHDDVITLVAQVQAEYVLIFGSPDESPIERKQFTPPRGEFAVGYNGEEPIAMGGWRLHDDGRAELKRMYVVESSRGNGYSRLILNWLEASAAAAGATALILETTEQSPPPSACIGRPATPKCRPSVITRTPSISESPSRALRKRFALRGLALLNDLGNGLIPVDSVHV
ncbi:hypothetical protein GCM10027403_16540 [Arthrobacter tecti]